MWILALPEGPRNYLRERIWLARKELGIRRPAEVDQIYEEDMLTSIGAENTPMRRRRMVITTCLARCILGMVRGDKQDSKRWTSAKRLELKWTSSQVELLDWINNFGCLVGSIYFRTPT
jgi:hypothetical protein